MRAHHIAIHAAALLALAAGAARADQTPVLTDVPAPGEHVHDGFYLRLGTGFGAYHETLRVSDGDEDSAVVTGMASSLEIAVGYAIRPGFILGLGWYSSHALETEQNVTGPMPPSEVTFAGGEVSLVGPFLDYYFDAARGLHVQAALGFGVVHGAGPQSMDWDDQNEAIGGGFTVGFGHEWWVSSQWGFGILARLQVVAAVNEADSGQDWTHTVGALPSLLFTATYN